MMHHAITIEENSEQNLHIWLNLRCFLRCGLWTLLLGWLGFGFNVITIHSWFVTSCDLFEQIWILIERRQHLLSDVHVALCLLKIYQFWNNFRCRRKNCLAWANDMATWSATSLMVIQRLSKTIIFFTATKTGIVIDIFSAFLKSVIPQLNLCSAHSRLAKLYSQHLKYPGIFNLIFYTELNTVSLIHFFE